MDHLLAARTQMGLSLGFHIIFACIGMAMPFLMAWSEWRWLRRGDSDYLNIAKAWSKGVALFFATGAVSGTVLSFELGLLWPEFMRHAGGIIGMPFSWEGTAFFLEAIALGFFLYGWDRLPRWLHWGAGLMVGVCGLASGILVLAANAWMNSPAGFKWVDGEAVDIDPVAAMFNDAWFSQAQHMCLSAFIATGFAVAGVHAFLLLRNPASTFHRKAFRMALAVGAVTALLQPLSGDFAAKDVAKRQPIKLAAMEAHFHTSAPASLWIGGIPDEQTQEVRYGLAIPRLLSFLAFGDFDSEVKGLEAFPRELWPPVLVVHGSFQIMVLCGFLMAATGLLFLLLRWRKPSALQGKAFLRLVIFCTPLGFIAVEAGWIVTEVGRQPWIIYGIMKTADAVTPMPGLIYSLIWISAIYLLLTVVLVWLMVRHIRLVPRLYEGAE